MLYLIWSFVIIDLVFEDYFFVDDEKFYDVVSNFFFLLVKIFWKIIVVGSVNM